MARLALAVDPDLGVGVAALAAAWRADEEARRLGRAVVEPAGGEIFLPGIVELVVIPLLVNVGSAVLYDIVKRLVRAMRESAQGAAEELEVAEITTASGDRLVVVRSRRWGR